MTRPFSSRSRAVAGFTLVELLVTMAIIAILATMVLGAIAVSQEAARETKTRSIIMTLNNIMMDEWDSYRTRRLPISMTNTERTSAAGISSFASRQLAARRELMRMELPDRWTDVVDAQVVLPSRPARSEAFLRKYLNGPNGLPSAKEQDSECLYLIVESLRSDEATELLKRHSGDTDGDGFLEILDGWGKPIRWIRWPAGFLQSNGAFTDAQSGDAVNQHDPFDPRKLHSGAYLLMPLIYSAGPDQVYDILGDFVNSAGDPTLHYRDAFAGVVNNPYVVDAGNMIGMPVDFDGDGLNHHDNIHNHILGLR